MYVCSFSIAGNAASEEEREKEKDSFQFLEIWWHRRVSQACIRRQSFADQCLLCFCWHYIYWYIDFTNIVACFTSHELPSYVNQYILYDQTKKETSTYHIKKNSITFNIFFVLHFRRLECLSVAPIKWHYELRTLTREQN